MIKLLEDLLIGATTNPNVPGGLVAGLRKAVDAARSAALPEPPVVLGYDKIIQALRTAPPPTAADLLPPPFDSQEEAQRAARMWPQEAEPATVRVAHPDTSYLVRLVAGDGYEVGQVAPNLLPEPLRDPPQWAPCDKAGWVSAAASFIPAGVEVEFRGSRDGGANPTDWRPVRPPKSSAIDEMAEPVAADPPYRVCIKAHETNVGNTVPVGHVVTLEPGESLQQPDCWVLCDKDGWVSGFRPYPMELCVEYKTQHEGRPVLPPCPWRPVRTPQFSFSTGHADAIPKPSAIDEMAEQMRRWAAPTREDAQPALAVQEGGSHYKIMKIQPVEYIHANGLGYFEGNVVKYVSRWRAKGGLQDLKKARHYLDLLIELEGDTK